MLKFCKNLNLKEIHPVSLGFKNKKIGEDYEKTFY